MNYIETIYGTMVTPVVVNGIFFYGYGVHIDTGDIWSFRNRKMKKLACNSSSTPYPQVGLSRPGKKTTTVLVHRAVA